MSRIPFPDIVIRPGTHLDTHLSSQLFSRCTVPVVCPASMHKIIAHMHCALSMLWLKGSWTNSDRTFTAPRSQDAEQQAVLRMCLTSTAF